MKSMFNFILIFILFTFQLVFFAEGKCVMYDTCENVPCVYNGPPLPLNLSASALKDMEYYCPSLDLTKDVCCSSTQVENFLKSIQLAKMLLKRCPSCLVNFLQAMCQLTCSPRQSDFLHVDNSTPVKNNKASITEASFIISYNYASLMLDSCRHVQFGPTNAQAIALMCQMHVDDCTPELLYETVAANSPFKLNIFFSNSTKYVHNNVTYTPMDFDTIPCSRGPSPGSPPCSCSDCTCDPLPIIPDASLWLIGTIPGSYIVMGALFTAFFIALVVAFIIQERRKKRDTPLLNISEDQIQSDAIQPLPDTYDDKESLSAIERILQRIFTSWGRTCAHHPLLVIVLSLIALAGLIYGVTYYQVTTDPVQLWSAPTSTARLQREHFDAHFGPFFRTEQIIMTPANKNGSIYDWGFFMKMVKLQEEVVKLTDESGSVTLDDICIKPVNDKCATFSAFSWFQNNVSNIDPETYSKRLNICSSNPFQMNATFSCFGDYGGPVFTYLALGGYEGKDYGSAKAYILTFPVKNHNKAADLGPALAWEKAFIQHLKNYSDPDVKIFFNTERSIEDELSRESESDITTIAISYLTMFIYVFLALGTYRTFDTWLLYSKLTLGIFGVVLVLASVVASVGFFSYLGVPATLIIIEVIPFLVLAVGVDNIFILVQTFERDNRREDETLEDQIGRVMGKVAPSLLLASISESLCFFLGALTTMPAVRIFALYAGLALFIDFLLQITCFLALLSLDARRKESSRLDILFCIRTRKDVDSTGSPGRIYQFFEKHFSKWLMSDAVRSTLLILFTGWLCLSLAVIPQIDVGLDQRMSMPKDSYVLDYFDGLAEYLEVGAPFYLVVKGRYNYSDRSAQNLLCGTTGCYRYSLETLTTQWVDQENLTFLAKTTNNWLDDYNTWMGLEDCCRYNETTLEYCPPTMNSTEWKMCSPCQKLKTGEDILWPEGEVFDQFLPHFLESLPDSRCPNGGKPSYGPLVELLDSSGTVGATAFMGYHSTLKDSHDFITALEMSRRLAANITHNLHANGIIEDVEVYTYSIFYVFYEQYLTIWKDLGFSLLISIGSIFVVTLLLMGLNLSAAFYNTFTIVAILANVMGLMYFLNIPLNAVSTVNLVMATGISVEFCSHITRAFILSKYSTRKERAQDALATMGSSVLSGITLTKFGGIVVLAFAKSQIFEVFYFRMYSCIVLCGATHGLIFLPILLSYFGPLEKPSWLHLGSKKRELYEKI